MWIKKTIRDILDSMIAAHDKGELDQDTLNGLVDSIYEVSKGGK